VRARPPNPSSSRKNAGKLKSLVLRRAERRFGLELLNTNTLLIAARDLRTYVVT
jgi:hypothetical protein